MTAFSGLVLPLRVCTTSTNSGRSRKMAVMLSILTEHHALLCPRYVGLFIEAAERTSRLRSRPPAPDETSHVDMFSNPIAWLVRPAPTAYLMASERRPEWEPKFVRGSASAKTIL